MRQDIVDVHKTSHIDLIRALIGQPPFALHCWRMAHLKLKAVFLFRYIYVCTHWSIQVCTRSVYHGGLVFSSLSCSLPPAPSPNYYGDVLLCLFVCLPVCLHTESSHSIKLNDVLVHQINSWRLLHGHVR